MKSNFDNREQRVLDNVKVATDKTKGSLSVLLETYKISKTSAKDAVNTAGNFTPPGDVNNYDNGMSGSMENSKKLVRTLGTPYNSSPKFSSTNSNSAPTNYNYGPVSSGEGFSQSQSGNVSTGTLVFIFSAILILMVCAITYFVLQYFGI